MTEGGRKLPSTIRLDAGESLQARVAQAVRAPLRPCLVAIAGPDLGKRQRLDGTALIGRDPEAQLCLSDPLVSFHHARIEDRGDGWALVDPGSTNGTQVNGERVSERVLAAGDKILLGTSVLRFEVQDETDQKYDELVQRLINIDDLTGLYLRRRFDQELLTLLQAAAANRQPVGMLVMDLDGIKAINDTHGHLFGAYVIAESGKVIGRVLDGGGIAARFGGDEFVAAVPGLDVASATQFAEAIRAAIAAFPFEREGIALRPGISIGVAAYPAQADDAETLFQRADEALYRAKSAGKNCVRT